MIRRTGRRRLATVVAVVTLVVVIVGAAAVGIDLLEAAIGGLGPPAAPPATPPATPTLAPPGTPASPATSAVDPTGSPVSAGMIVTSPSALTAVRASTAVPASTTAPTPATPAGPAPTSAASPAPPAASATPAAPTDPAGFKVRATVVAMGFPLPATSRYRFGDGWRARRAGVVYQYNQIRGIAPDGSLLRAHDGTDLVVPTGTLVVSPWNGVVVDPRRLWTPWDPARYGKVVVIRSTEPTSRGYLVILAHLSRQSVALGNTVRRGQVVGRTGRTGNAAGTAPHLHTEIRSPFKIRYGYAGVRRQLDVFDIEPSLRAADPNAG